jgi:hypothetical protein
MMCRQASNVNLVSRITDPMCNWVWVVLQLGVYLQAGTRLAVIQQSSSNIPGGRITPAGGMSFEHVKLG